MICGQLEARHSENNPSTGQLAVAFEGVRDSYAWDLLKKVGYLLTMATGAAVICIAGLKLVNLATL